MGFRWLLGCSQGDCGLREHFATTVAHLWASCVLSVAIVYLVFIPLYIIIMPYLWYFCFFVPTIGDFREENGIYSTREV